MDSPVTFVLNGKEISTFLSPSTPLLDFIRKEMSLTGTKEGCREGDCGACTVLIGEIAGSKTSYKAVNSCLIPLGMVHGKHLVTIEGVNQKSLTPFQEALLAEGAIQCGFCTPGLIMSMTGFLLSDKYLSLENAIDAIAGNICRCTGYASLKRAVYAFLMESEISLEPGQKRLESLIGNGFLPLYFMNIPSMLQNIAVHEESTPEESSRDKSKVLISGGTDLMLQKRDEVPDINFLFLKENQKEKIRVEEGFIILDAAATASDIMASEVMRSCFPEIENYIKFFGSRQIRNQATLGGNIVNASPIADMANIFLAFRSILIIKNKKEIREVPLKDFYLGYKSLSKEYDEQILQLKFPLPEGNYYFNYEKISRRTHLDIASVNSSIYMKTEDGVIKDIHISAGGVAPYPLYLKETVFFLTGREITPENLHDAALVAQAEISPISDIRGSAGYKRLLLRQLIFAHFMKFYPELMDNSEILLTQ